jgi:hypothetical protein
VTLASTLESELDPGSVNVVPFDKFFQVKMEWRKME